eukprot:c21652_g1_i1 orf=331-2223(+)
MIVNSHWHVGHQHCGYGRILVDLHGSLRERKDGCDSGEFCLFVDLTCSSGKETSHVDGYGAGLSNKTSGRLDSLDQQIGNMHPFSGKTSNDTNSVYQLHGENTVLLNARFSRDPSNMGKVLGFEDNIEEKKVLGSNIIGCSIDNGFVEVRGSESTAGLPLQIPLSEDFCVTAQTEGQKTWKRTCGFSEMQVDSKNALMASSSKRGKWSELSREECGLPTPMLKKPVVSSKRRPLCSKGGWWPRGNFVNDSLIVGQRDVVKEFKCRVNESWPTTPALEPQAVHVEHSKENGNLGKSPLHISGTVKVLSSTSGNSMATLCDDISREEEAIEFEQCVSLLRKYGVLKSPEYYLSQNLPSSALLPGLVGDKLFSKTCKICGNLEDAKNTLICDECQEAFHMSCCNPRVSLKYFEKEDDWYCSLCRKQKKKTALKFSMEVLPSQGNTVFIPKVSPSGALDSFRNVFPMGSHYTSKVRLGPAHQVDVPPWTGRVKENLNTFIAGCFGTEIPLTRDEKVAEQDQIRRAHEDRGRLLHWLSAKSLPQGLKENWLQCHCIVKKGIRDLNGQKVTNDVICGKWRRVPLGLEQKESWECFCAIFWDPSHADCAVPQELATEDIVKRMQLQSTNSDNVDVQT